MKTKKRRILAFFMTLTMLLTMSGVSILAVEAESLPAILDAPNVILYDDGYYNMNLVVKAETPKSVMDFYEKAYTNAYYENDKHYSDYGEWTGGYLSGIQVDWKIDDGEWRYTANWDASLSNSGYYTYHQFEGYQITRVNIGTVTSYYDTGIATELKTLGYLTETTDGSSTYYRLDTENHMVTVRARYIMQLTDQNYNTTTILSDWSETASYGNGNQTVTTAPSNLSAPTLANLKIDDINAYNGSPATTFDVYPAADVVSAMMWSEQYNSALENSDVKLIVETSTDRNFGVGATIVQETIYENSSLKRQIDYDSMFYDLWYALPGSDREAFCWNGETIYVRAKWVNSRTVSDSTSSIESPYSNVLSINGPEIGTYDITITHDTYGLDTEEYYSESYKITQGCELDDIACAPLEGCYVDTITVNGTVMYDHDDERTHELLYSSAQNTWFSFIGEAQYATQDLTIVITYAGTPTATYGITTECGTGGYLTTDAYYDSWDDNSLVVYHGTAPKLTIHNQNGYEIDKVLIDGVENAQAKADGYYTFPAIIDSTHSISVTFKRVAYQVSSYVYHGTITTDYEGYASNNYVKIGDDITFTFEPAQDASGNYYEIEAVSIDYVLNEAAKNAGTYTFTNVQADHSISVRYSEDPVITHDITATSGENGSISPEGVVHVRENSTKRFEFIPDAGYEVDKVFVDNVEISNLASKEYYNIANVTEDHSIHVTFKKLPVQHDVNVIVSGHNPSVHTVNPKGVTPVWDGDGFTVTYSPFAGYEVEKVLVNGSPVTADGTYSIADVNADCTIEIFFKIKTYTVTFVDYDGTTLKTETVEHGAQATAPAAPTREHYVFDRWDAAFNDVTANVTIRATYKPAEYTVKFLSWDGQVLKTQTVKYSEDATAPEAPAREGYDFSRWSHDYTNVSANLEVTAVYTQKEYTVRFVDSDDTVLSTQTVKHGEAATAPVNPTKDGYTFIGWDNTNYGRVTQNMTIKAMYVEGIGVTYTITARALGNTGTVSPIGTTTILENGSLTLHFTPNELSKIVKVVVDGTEIEVCSSYTFDDITANHTIDVYFAPTAVININEDNIEHGTAAGHYELIDGTMVYVLDINPAEGYELDGIFIDGELAELEALDGKYIIRNLSEDMEIDVRFKIINTGSGEDNDPQTPGGDSGDGDQKPGGNNDNENGNGSSDISNPQTGDNSNFAFWIALMAIASLGIIFSLKKKRAVN